jgi:Ca2+-binding EF-hand superfamily protein
METNITTVEQTEISQEEITEILETITSESNNPLYLKEFLSVNSLLLKKSFSDDYEQLAKYLGGEDSPISARTMERWRVEKTGPTNVMIGNGRLDRYCQSEKDSSHGK